MITRFGSAASGVRVYGRLTGVSLILAASIVTVTCDRVPLLAPSGSTIVLTASANAISANGTAQLIAQILEPAGTPPHPGTQVIFTTTLGIVEPVTAETDVNGRALAIFRGNGVNGIATINAGSGGATTASTASGSNGNTTTPPTNAGTGPVRIFVGAAAVGRVSVNATPATIPSGGTSTIAAAVYDVNGSPLSNTAVSFSTDAGTLSSSLVTTNGDGIAATQLSTSQTATITASVGATAPPASGGTNGGTTTGQTSGTAKVTVIPNTTVTITPPSTPPSAGLPAVFTFVVTIPTGGNPVRELRVSWGDGTPQQNLGAVSGSQIVSHVYTTADSYVVTATVVDVAGISQTVSSTVTVIPVPHPTVIVTPSPQSAIVNQTVNFRIEITAPAGIGIQQTVIDFGDGQSQALGGATFAVVPHQYLSANPPTKLVTVTVLDTAKQTTIGTTTVSVSP